MTQSVMDQIGEQIDETARKASRAASAVADVLEDSAEAARRAAKNGRQAASEFYIDTRKRVQRNPVESIAATFAIGILAGATVGWLLGRRTR
ncbi:MAG: hypothetical protein ABR907_04760 [Terracidiphilus sp.]|jgi:ElaB/YqjD/DUF883 family membrane-anchored ribosome-binding protein